MLQEDICVNVKKSCVVLDWDGSEIEEECLESERVIRKKYISDDRGYSCEVGNDCETGDDGENRNYLTIEFEIHPYDPVGGVFYYNTYTNQNVYADFVYELSVNGSEFEELTCEGDICEILEGFDLSGTYTDEKYTLTYAEYIPEHKDEKLPLIIWLHGMGEGGTDPSVTLLGNRVAGLREEKIQKLFGPNGAAILSPQCQTMWMDVNGEAVYNTDQLEESDGYSVYENTLKAFLLSYIEQHEEIDRSRIYIGGCSNGGYMTIKMLLMCPELFAGAFPICAAYHDYWMNEERGDLLKKTPIWFTAAKTDMTIPIINEDGSHSYSLAIYEKLCETAPNMHYALLDRVVDPSAKYMSEDGTDLFEYFGHWSWIPVLRNQVSLMIDGEETTIFEWLSEQSL